MPARERPCLEHVQRCPGLLVAFSLSLVSFKTGGHKPETKLRTFAAQAMGTFTPAARVLSWSSGQLRTPENPDNPKPKLSTSAKLGFHFSANIPEVSLVFWTGVFLSPGRRICVIGKETGPGPGGYG